MNRAAARTPSRSTPCAQPLAVEQVDEVLGGQVAGRPGANGEPPVPPVEASKVVTPSLHARPSRWPAPCRACRGSAGRSCPGRCRRRPARPAPGARRRVPPRRRVSLIASSSTPMARSRSDTATTAPRVDLALVRAAEGGAHVGADPPAAPARLGRDRLEGGQRLLMLMPMLCRTYESVAAVIRQMASTPAAHGALQAALVRHQHRVAHAGSPVQRAAAASSASASCGIAVGRNERGGLDLAQAGVGQHADEARACPRSATMVGSACRPSRGPTS